MKLVEVAIALVWRGTELLVTRRPDAVHLGGLWEFPGGKIAPGETPEACAEREVLEEVGLLVTARARRKVIEHTYPERRVKLYPIDCDYVTGVFRSGQWRLIFAQALKKMRSLCLQRLLKIDFRNAFNLVVAGSFLRLLRCFRHWSDGPAGAILSASSPL